jgi:purine-binding chemotaxis protein CheW
MSVSSRTAVVVVVTIDGDRYALPLDAVGEVVRAVAVTPLASVPRSVLGVVNLHGTPVPVLSLRRVAGATDRGAGPGDRMVEVRLRDRNVLLLVDGVVGPAPLAPGAVTAARSLLPPPPHLRGVAALEDGVLLIEDPDGFLSLEEEAVLEAALAAREEA